MGDGGRDVDGRGGMDRRSEEPHIPCGAAGAEGCETVPLGCMGGADGAGGAVDGLAGGWGAAGLGEAWGVAVATGDGALALVGPVISPFRTFSSSR